jgi:putative ABC transport system permease protein
MVARSLFTKSIRDMKKSKVQFISIFVMAVLSVTIVTGLDSMWKTIGRHSDAMYAASDISDMWVNIENPSEKEMWTISGTRGVETAEKRFVIDALADLAGRPTLKIYTVSGNSSLDRPILKQGRLKTRGGAVIDSSFAKEHGLKIGDEVDLKVNGRWTSFTIEGTAMSSEHIYSVNGTTAIIPDHRKYGFIVINEDMLRSIFGRKIFNQVCVRLSPGADMQTVEAEIDEALGDRLIGIVKRGEDSSTNNVLSNISQFRTLAAIFPLMFFIVTALITQSTMLRLVENQRGQIGVLKALGYTKGRILWHYTSYGMYMGLAGAFVGLLLGPNLFGRILIPWLNLTLADDRILVNYPNFVLSLILILSCTGGVSLYAGLRLLKDSPAMLLRDKPPKEGKHIFLEGLPKLWNRMRFSRKLIARNTVRNRLRTIMSIIGITGCTGLIVAAFTLTVMVNGIAGHAYETTYTYDQKIILDEKVDSRFIRNIRLDGTVAQIAEMPAAVITPDGKRAMKMLFVFPKDSRLIHLKDIDGNDVRLPDDGTAITRKLAETLDVKTGDVIKIKGTDGSYVETPVRQIIYMATGQGFFMSDKYYESLGETFKPTAILVRWNGQPDRAFLESDYVDEYVDRVGQMRDVKASTKVVYIAAILLIFMGGILAFIVLYNSSMLNFTERIRDLATLKVLGFYQGEIRSLVLTENIISVVTGAVLGIPVGKVIAGIISRGLDDQMDLVSRISLQTVAVSGAITLAFALIINRIVAVKMKNIDMLESLKSVE